MATKKTDKPAETPPPVAPITPSVTREQPVTVGRNVHFHTAEQADPLHAQIIKVGKPCELVVFWPSEYPFPGPRNTFAEFSDTPKPGCWNWPPRV